MKTIKIKYLILISILGFIGCGDDDVDLVSPTMEAVRYVPQPQEDDICGAIEPVVFRLSGGEELLFDVVFSDNEALSQYKIDIHNNFDCHGHGGGVAPNVVVPNVINTTTDWTVLKISDISGTAAPVIETLTVPENVTTGNYHFQIQVIDESGNDNPAANFFALKITNPLDAVLPQINVQLPASNSFAKTKGETIVFKGQVTDDRSLSDGGNGVLYLAYTDLSSGNTFVTSEVYPFDADVDKTFDFDFEYTIPQTLVAGDYRFSLGANDGVRNVAEFIFFDVAVQN